MKLKDLAMATGMPERTIRYLIAEGLAPPAGGTGRTLDAYGPAHLEAIRATARLLAAGLTVPAIVAMRKVEGDARVLLDDGRFQLRLSSPDALAGFGDDDLADLLADVRRVVGEVLRATTREAPAPADAPPRPPIDTPPGEPAPPVGDEPTAEPATTTEDEAPCP